MRRTGRRASRDSHEADLGRRVGSRSWRPLPCMVLATERSGTRAQWAAALRFVAAAVFIAFGVGKFVNHATELASFRQYGLPAPDAFVYAIGLVEIVGGMLLAIGLLVRPAALALAGDMIGAIIVSGVDRGENVSLTLAPVMLVAMCLLIWTGAGRAALDPRVLARWSDGRRRETA